VVVADSATAAEDEAAAVAVAVTKNKTQKPLFAQTYIQSRRRPLVAFIFFYINNK
jgi:hypothetical protein